MRRSIFLLAFGLPGLFMVSETSRMAVADVLGESYHLSILRKAIALDPANPKLHGQVALFYFYSLENLNSAEAVQHLSRATELDPYESFFWMNLATVREATGETALADMAFMRALELRPMSPSFRWIAANYFLRRGRPDLACPQFQRLLELSAEYAPATFRLCLRALDNPETIYQRVLPAGGSPAIKVAYIDFLSAHGELGSAFRLWNRTIANAPSLDFRSAEPFLERLIEQGWAGEAQSVWLDLQRLGIVQKPPANGQDNLTFNGDFEQLPLNAGFDWRYHPQPYLSVNFPASEAYSGSHCLRLHFNAPRNEEYEAVSQIIPVVPNRAYLLTAAVRSKDLASDSGPRLRIRDFYHPSSLDIESIPTVGTTPWHRLSLAFPIGEETRLLKLSVHRSRSRTFPGEVSGTFWLDSLSLRILGPASEKIPLNFTR